jgi:hypothetical protein
MPTISWRVSSHPASIAKSPQAKPPDIPTRRRFAAYVPEFRFPLKEPILAARSRNNECDAFNDDLLREC